MQNLPAKYKANKSDRENIKISCLCDGILCPKCGEIKFTALSLIPMNRQTESSITHPFPEWWDVKIQGKNNSQ